MTQLLNRSAGWLSQFNSQRI